MNLSISLETAADFRVIENLTREAFWDVYKPGCNEHLLVHKLRSREAFVRELDLVVGDDDVIIANIIYSRARVVNDAGQESEVLCMGPVSVLPSYQRQGIGSMLIKYSLELARQYDYKGVILFGNPDYYHRFGFVNAGKYGIRTSEGANFEPFMALELSPGSLDGISGKFYEDAAFQIDPAELEEFEKQFPYREKHVTDTQL